MGGKLKIIVFAFLILTAAAFARRWEKPVPLETLNSSADEFAPVWNPYEKIFYYNSTRNGTSFFYSANFNKGVFGKPKALPWPLNEKGENRAYFTFESPTKAYLSAFREFDDQARINIFQTRKKKGEWIKPFAADSFNLPFYIGQPTVSSDGSFMIFASDMNSEFGDLDLWQAFKMDNGTWGGFVKLKNLATPGNEITPSLASDDTLFFASDGQEGPGGYDLFYSVFRDGEWGAPFPLNEINAEFDESDPAVLPDGSIVFASNRPGGKGGLDLYLAKIEKRNSETVAESKKPNLEFTITAQSSSVKARIEKLSQKRKFASNFAVFEKISDFDPKSFVAADYDDFNSIFNFWTRTLIERAEKIYRNRLFIDFYCQNADSAKRIIEKAVYGDLKASREKTVLRFFGENEKFKNFAVVAVFTARDEKTFIPIELRARKIRLFPPVLECSFDARPREAANRFDVFLKADGVDKKIFADLKLPSKVFAELNPFANAIADDDAIVLKAKVKLAGGGDSSFARKFDVYRETVVSKSEGELPRYEIFVLDERAIKSGGFFDFCAREIAETAAQSERSEIFYFENSSRPLAEAAVWAIRNERPKTVAKIKKELPSAEIPLNLSKYALVVSFK